MIVSTDQQAFSVTILVKGSDETEDQLQSLETAFCSPQSAAERDKVGQLLEAADHETCILAGLAGLREQGLLLDIRLWAEGHSFQAHRVVLASASNYFKVMFTSGMKESQWRQTAKDGHNDIQDIILPGVSANGLRLVLDFVYTGQLSLTPDNIEEVLACAAHLQVPMVVGLCATFLDTNTDLDNCVDILTLADTFALQKLRQQILRFLSENLKQFVKTSGWQRLEVGQLRSLLSSNFPINMAESDVLGAAVEWIEHDLAARQHLADSVVDGVRLTDIPSRDMVVLIDRPGLMSLRDKLAALERLSPLRQSDTFKMVNSRGMKMAVVKVGGFGPEGITNSISYFHHNGSVSPPAWHHLTSVPHVESCNSGVAVLHNQLYIVGGCFNQGLQENIHPFGFCYNPRLNKWSTISAMVRERCRFSLTECGGQLYAVGGCSETGEMEDDVSVEVYSTETDSWRVTARLPDGSRSQHGAVKRRERVLISGGLDQDIVLDTMVEYRPEEDCWNLVTKMPRPRADHSMLVHDDIVFLVGGWRESEEGRVLIQEVDRYDLLADTWTVETNLPCPRFHAGVTKVGNKIFVIGGFRDDDMLDRATGAADSYDLSTSCWDRGPDYPHNLWEHAAVTLNVPVCREDQEILLDQS